VPDIRVHWIIEDLDVKTWTIMGVDYLKYDLCSTQETAHRIYYILMGRLLEKSDRSMLYSLGAAIKCRMGRSCRWASLALGRHIRDQWYLGNQNGVMNA